MSPDSKACWSGLASDRLFSASPHHPPCIYSHVLKCFKANMNFPIFSGPLQTGYWCLHTEGKSLLASRRWRVLKWKRVNHSYCSKSPLMMPGYFPVCFTHMHRHIFTMLAHAAVNKPTVAFTMAVCSASRHWIFLFFLLFLHNTIHLNYSKL